MEHQLLFLGLIASSLILTVLGMLFSFFLLFLFLLFLLFLSQLTFSHSIGYSCEYAQLHGIQSLNNDFLSGSYVVPMNERENQTLYCDMITDGGGWTLIANVPPGSWLPGTMLLCSFCLASFLQNPSIKLHSCSSLLNRRHQF